MKFRQVRCDWHQQVNSNTRIPKQPFSPSVRRPQVSTFKQPKEEWEIVPRHPILDPRLPRLRWIPWWSMILLPVRLAGLATPLERQEVAVAVAVAAQAALEDQEVLTVLRGLVRVLVTRSPRRSALQEAAMG